MWEASPWEEALGLLHEIRDVSVVLCSGRAHRKIIATATAMATAMICLCNEKALKRAIDEYLTAKAEIARIQIDRLSLVGAAETLETEIAAKPVLCIGALNRNQS